MTAPPVRLGAIDVGSNSIRLLVADCAADGTLAVVDELKSQPRLAAGLATTRQLAPAAIEEALRALERMRDVARRREVAHLAAVATAAVREAENGPAFARRAQQILGVPLDIIDPEREARLSYRSIAHHFRIDDRRTVVLDIGGGSLEVVGAVRGLIESTRSLPLGAVRLTDLQRAKQVTGTPDVPALRKRARRTLRAAGRWREWTGAQVFGSGGTFTNLGRIAAARRGLTTAAVHGIQVTTAEVEHLLDWLGAMSPEERRTVPGLNPERADIILAGLAVTCEILEQIDASAVTVSAFGIREGLLLEMAGALATPADAAPTPDPLGAARDFAHRCQCDPQHIEQVRRLAVLLFDRLAVPLGAAPEERHLLETAALLHDVGQLVSYRKRHLHSYELIMHADRLHLSMRDRQLVALAARYHRKDTPSGDDTPFADLSRNDRQLVRRITALLAVADGLDRGYAGVVGGIRTRLTARRLRITPVPASPKAELALECWGAGRRTKGLERLLKRPVVVG